MGRRTVAFLVSMLLVMVSALSTGASLYYLLLSMMFMMLLASLVSILISMNSIKVSCSLPPHQIMRGDTIQLTITSVLLSPMPLGSLSIVLDVPEDGGTVNNITISPFPYQKTALKHQLKCPHRGIFHVGVSHVFITDVFGLFTFPKRLKSKSCMLTVSPHVDTIPSQNLLSGENGPEQYAKLTDDTASPADVRQYIAGDTLKKIHWKLTMRKREIMVRQYEEAPRPDTLVLVDCANLPVARELQLDIEDAICEIAASVAKAQLTAGYPVRMPLFAQKQAEPSGQTIAEFPRFLDSLTTVEFDGTHPYEKVFQLETRRMQRTGGLVLITSRLTTQIADMAMQLRRTGILISTYWVTDSQTEETNALIVRLRLAGIIAKKVSPFLPWNERNLT